MIAAQELDEWPMGIHENWQKSIKNHLTVSSLLAADLQLVFNHACIHTQKDMHTLTCLDWHNLEDSGVGQGIRDLLLTSDTRFLLHVNWFSSFIVKLKY